MTLAPLNMSARTLAAGLAIIIVTNLIVLGGVAYNRAGQPDAVVDLSERELSLPPLYQADSENSSMALNINCRIETETAAYNAGSADCLGNPGWLNKEKLLALGFALQPRQDKRPGYVREDKTQPRRVYLVLEQNGDAYQRSLAGRELDLAEQQGLLANMPDKADYKRRVKVAENMLDRERHDYSRLFAIDAGLDMTVLRSRYPDRRRYILMQALVRPVWRNTKRDDDWQGTITELLVDTIYIPLEYRAVFDSLEETRYQTGQDGQGSHYKVRVAVGRRAEPWILAVETSPDAPVDQP